VLVYRLANLDLAIAELRDREGDLGMRFEIPHGPGAEITNPGPHRVALYELSRPQADKSCRSTRFLRSAASTCVANRASQSRRLVWWKRACRRLFCRRRSLDR